MQVRRAVARQPQQLAGRAERLDELDRLVDVAPDQDRAVAALETDVAEARVQEHVARGVGVRHRERAGPAGRLVVLLGPLDDLLHDLLRAVEPPIVDPLAPDDHRELAAGLERGVDVAERGDRVGEEHRPEAGERAVEVPLERKRLLDVGAQELGVAHPGLRRLGDRGLDEARRRVDADRLAVGADELRDPLGGVAEAAADVEDLLAGLRRVQPQRLLAVDREAAGDDVAVADEAVEERSVPGGDRLCVDAAAPVGSRGHCATLRFRPPEVERVSGAQRGSAGPPCR